MWCIDIAFVYLKWVSAMWCKGILLFLIDAWCWWYLKQNLLLISDQKKFRKLKEDPTLKRQRALQQTLCEINKKNKYSDFEYSNLYPKSTKPARLCGIPKIHKTFLPGSLPPFQPIVSSNDTYNYNLAQYLGSLLSPHIPSD